ncbi:hypothetical protein PS627_00150 [Pseudomonas fluorescens]|uniref:hypothetical protein n=1 Tax=Pseudomonas fluorescens TaxID=294 RepID=UPI0012593830|nr:hypothetical protein [Pseudomonas fluorescens]CAG8863214.1 hypothetical protein PS627_00150 [Pseudomonas fluorescens]VVQ05005.1 hypothetical protein PS910_04204 [Pseudomonas fluorescens]
MSKRHDQAMHSIYQQVLARLLGHMSQAQRASLQLLIQRLVVAAGGLERIGDFTLLLLDAGDRRSAHALACLRAAQLSIATRSRCTFTLRVAVARMTGVGSHALGNCERSFSALFLHDDPRVQLLMIEDGQVMPFDSRRPQPRLTQEREAFLLFGHLAAARPHCMIGSRHHLALADAYTKVLSVDGEASALVCALPTAERQRYLGWARRCLRHAGQPTGWPLRACARTLAAGLSHLHHGLERQLRGTELIPAGLRNCASAVAPLEVIAVDGLLHDLAAPQRLDYMLGHREGWADGVPALEAASDPVLVAHLHGLRGEYFSRRGYEEGFNGYIWRMRGAKPDVDIPGWESVRAEASLYFEQAFELRDPQLACVLYAPFIARGQRLEYYLRRCQPAMRVALPYLHRALQGRECPQAVEHWLVSNSGLSMTQLQRLYRHHPSSVARTSLLAQVAARDIDLRR